MASQVPYPGAHPPIHNAYQPLSESEIYAIKRTYLGLLPASQIIDMCLTFEAHAPLHVKSTVWPYDIRAAIAAIQAQNAQNVQSAQSTQNARASASPEGAGPAQAAASTSEVSPAVTGNGNASHENDASPSAPASDSPNTPAEVGSSNPPPPTAADNAQPQPPSQTQTPTQPPIHPPGQPPPYPHQPYYSPAYPHAPYYPPHPPHHPPYNYPHGYLPSFPPPPPPPPGPYSPGQSSHPPPLFSTAPLSHPPHPPHPHQHDASVQPPNAVDDLPSYEEMIVEALNDCGDPEGCAPKALFSWMAMHYPLQTNFRPSASQALQKAFKRGRLEKGSNGKYRLNVAWEGGNTSRRTTRRPQTQAQTMSVSQSAGPSPSPFTRVPLSHNPTNNPYASSAMQSRPPGYPGYSSYGGYGYPGHTPQPLSQAENTNQTVSAAPFKAFTETSDDMAGNDAWEAAQNILKAINFGELLQMSGANGETSPSASTTTEDVSPTAHPDQLPTTALNADPTLNHNLNGGPSATAVAAEGNGGQLTNEQRAALQAQLALLAAQLADIAELDEAELAHDLNMSIVTEEDKPENDLSAITEDGLPDDFDEDDEYDLEEVAVPMTSLTA